MSKISRAVIYGIAAFFTFAIMTLTRVAQTWQSDTEAKASLAQLEGAATIERSYLLSSIPILPVSCLLIFIIWYLVGRKLYKPNETTE